MRRTRRAILGTIGFAVGLLALAGRGTPAAADGGLAVAVVDGVHGDSYPTMTATLAVVDSANGQPLTKLEVGDVTVGDEAGAATVLSVAPTTSNAIPTAYVLLFDTSGGMQAYVSREQEIARQFVSQLGPRDVVRVVKFNAGTDEQNTAWWLRDDPNLAAAINSLTTTSAVALVDNAMGRASALVNTAPEGIQRKALVAFVTVDGVRAEPTLTAEQVKNRFPPTTFTFGFGTEPTDDPRLPQLLDNLGRYSGGAYWLYGSAGYPADPMAALFDVTRRTWEIKFRADGLPDGKEHAVTFAVKSADRHSGSVETHYTSGTVIGVTPVKFQGIREGESVDSDRDVLVSVGGTKTWSTTRLELFEDCDPGSCEAVASGTKASLSWKLASAPLSQGKHKLAVRLTVNDGTRQFSDVQELHFARAGTSFNVGAISLFLGAGGIAIAATAIVIRRRLPTAEFS